MEIGVCDGVFNFIKRNYFMCYLYRELCVIKLKIMHIFTYRIDASKYKSSKRLLIRQRLNA